MKVDIDQKGAVQVVMVTLSRRNLALLMEEPKDGKQPSILKRTSNQFLIVTVQDDAQHYGAPAPAPADPAPAPRGTILKFKPRGGAKS